ncbi:MAG: FIG00907047: phosphodiesterase/nucleotide pyrophosphatase, partial [uncultured Phycisphaerae bacterium]
LLAGRRPGAGLRADGRHPPQAGVRPGRDVPRPEAVHGEGPDRLDAAAEETGVPDDDAGDRDGRDGGEGEPRPPAGDARGGAAGHDAAEGPPTGRRRRGRADRRVRVDPAARRGGSRRGGGRHAAL